jgi:adenylosuccinate synthase
MMVNQIIEDARGITRHGSCGMGINETIERSGVSEWCIRAADLMVPDRIAAKMQAIYNDYLPFRIAALGLELKPAQVISLSNPVLTTRFVEICAKMKGKIFINDAAILNSYGDIIFEGAQGLLLDQDHEFFPHVTRSNTGLKNVAEILDDFDTVETRVDYVVRAYMTRHGSGPFPSQADDLVYEDLTNRPNPWQGSLRFGAFDTRLVVSAIKKDIAANALTGMKTRLVMTHTDQVAGGAPALVDDQVQLVNWHYIADTVVFDARLDDMAHSNGPTRDNVNIAF